MSQPKKQQDNKVARVNLAYCSLLLALGMCIGFYLLPFFFKKSEQTVFDEGVLFGILYYREYLHNNGTFDYVSDSCVSIQTNKDSFMIYK